jgi:hypothetical protein
MLASYDRDITFVFETEPKIRINFTILTKLLWELVTNLRRTPVLAELVPVRVIG